VDVVVAGGAAAFVWKVRGAELVAVELDVSRGADPLLVRDNCEDELAGGGAKLNPVDAGGADVTVAAGAVAPNENADALVAGAAAAEVVAVVVVVIVAVDAAGNENPVRDGATETVGAEVTGATAGAGVAVGAGNSEEDDVTADIPVAGAAAAGPNENAGVVNEDVVVDKVAAGVACGKLKPDPVLAVAPNAVAG
jgi:hypothetical protein